MKNKIIKITNHSGEIENGHSCNHNFNGGNFVEKESDINVVYYVGVSVIDKETNSILTVEKDFYDKKSALKYLRMFVSKKPICEAIILEKSQKQICHYV